MAELVTAPRSTRMKAEAQSWRRRVDPTSLFAPAFLAAVLILNLVTNGDSFSPSNLPETFGLAAPTILAAFTVTPTLLSGNGGIDLSAGPLIGLVSVIVVHNVIGNAGISDPVIVVFAALGVGLFGGAINGVLVAYLRIEPIVATLGTYLVYSGLALALLASPSGSVPGWLGDLGAGASVVTVLAALAVWWLFTRLPVYGQLMAAAGDERAAYTSGINTARITMIAYCLGGLIAGIGGLALAAALGSADPTVGPSYTLTGIAAAAFGGISLAGGRGGIRRALVGAAAIFLLEDFLTYLNVSPFLLDTAYGAVLVIAVALNGGASKLVAHRQRRTT
jgi:ribose transport system permease protein